MQNTRLNILISNFINQCRDFVDNPWRNLSFIIISWLFGFTIPTVITSTISQGGSWDTVVALFFLIFIETLNKILSSQQNNQPKPWWKDTLYSFKIGFMYGLFLDGTILTS